MTLLELMEDESVAEVQPGAAQEVDEVKAARIAEYEARKAAKVERLQARAEKARQEAAARFENARRQTEGIVFGQPILVGHHSEGRHRAAIKRHDQNMNAGCRAMDKAQHYDRRAEAAESNHAISGDDPAAIDKLRAKLAQLQVAQEKMRAANKLARKGDRDGLAALGFNETTINELLNPKYSYEKPGFQGWQLSNNNANIKRVRQRIEQLEKAEARGTVEIEASGVRVVDNVEENRLQLIFPGKPSEEVRAVLKRHAFKWSPRNGAWQRQRSGNANFAAKCVMDFLGAQQSD